ncbi:MAG: RNA-binding S4 domain-containing protein [Solirubrobacteraceae bacterium]
MRIDRWLWAARLAKTRPLAADAVRGGRVHVNGAAAKPSREVRIGDVLEITTGPVPRVVQVRGLAERRGPAPEAALLYEETPESVAARLRHAEDRRLMSASGPVSGGRPTKRERRRWRDAQG